MIFSELLIATQDDQIDLLRANRYGEGVGLNRYTPGAAGYKDGGIWADSPLAPGRRRVAGQQTNYVDALQLKISYKNARQVIEAYRDLKFFEGLANSYWDDEWQQSPAWLVARVTGETARRYAIIYLAQLSDLPDPYQEPFQGGAAVTLEGISLGIERGPWTDTPPLQATQVPLINTGVESAITDWLWVTNGSNPHGGLTHIYSHTISDSGATETDSDNLLEEPLPYPLFDSDPEIGSAIYFGSDYPFGGLVFNLSQSLSPASGTKALEWEYWTGANWGPIDTSVPEVGINSYRDGTDEFGNLGTHAIVWAIPDNWEKTEPRTYPEKYWMRARIADGFMYDRPFQAVRHIYALANNHYVEIAGGSTDGDIDNLLRLRLLTEGTLPNENWIFPQDGTLPIILRVGLRSYTRGANFTPWLNLSTSFNPVGLNADIPPIDAFPANSISLLSTFADNYTKQRLRVITGDNIDPGSIGTIWIAQFTRTILHEYYGEYRLFARAFQDDVFEQDEDGAFLRYSAHFMQHAYPGIVEGEWARVGKIEHSLIDLGRIRIPMTSFVNPNEVTRELYLRLQLKAGPEVTVWVSDLFLLPIDEWSAEVDVSAFLNQQYDRIVNIDSALNPRRPMRCMVEVNVNGNIDIERTAPLLTTGEAILHSGVRQRIYFLFSSPYPAPGETLEGIVDFNGASLSVGVKAEAINRYTYLR